MFTDDWVSAHAPTWWRTLGHWKDRPVNMLEIGSHEGRSAIWWAQNVLQHPKSRLTCLDPWHGDEARYNRFKRNVALSGAGRKIKAVRIPSQQARIPEGTFDLIYLDGDHQGHVVYQDLLLCWHALKRNGVCVLDDYEWKKEGVIGPKAAIDGFLASFGNKLRVFHKGYQVMFKKLV